jgi:hypothetical protein
MCPLPGFGSALAAARQERGAKMRNTIAVFELDGGYQILNSRIVGLLGGGTADDEKDFDNSVNFEIHDIIENANKSILIICGSISRYSGTVDKGEEGDAGSDKDEEDKDPPVQITSETGVVIILNSNLNVLSIREYPDVKSFYSVYSDDDYFYVCGFASKPDEAGNNYGIVLQDRRLSMNPKAYITTQPWEYHKIKAINNGNDIAVSGTDGDEIGFTAFDVVGGNFVPIQTAGQDESWKFSTLQPLQANSKVPVTSDPNNQQGLILSAMTYAATGYEIEMYMFSNYQTLSNGYVVSNLPFSHPSVSVLEDAGTSAFSMGEIAWVGNITPVGVTGARPNYAFFLSVDMAFQRQPIHDLFEPSSQNPMSYFSLHKVHVLDDFRCAGFYNHDNNNRATFNVKPAGTPHGGCSTQNSLNMPTSISLSGQIDRLPVTEKNVEVKSHSWYEKQYNFCDTDCDDTPLNNAANNNCGNQ